MPSSDTSAAVSWTTAIVTWLLVALGWVVTHRSATARDRERDKQKGVRDLVSECSKALQAIREMAIKYHTNDRDRDIERQLRFELQIFAHKLNALFPLVRSLSSDPKEKLLQLRQAVTLHHFADEHKSPVTTDDELILTIDGASYELLAYMDKVIVNSLVLPEVAPRRDAGNVSKTT